MKGKRQTVRRICCCGGPLEYTLERKRVKNINLRVRQDGSIYASAPLSVSGEQVDAFVCSKEALIRKARSRFLEQEKRKPQPLTGMAGETVTVLGKAYVLEPRPAETDRVELQENRLVVETPVPGDGRRILRMTDAFLEDRCREVFGRITAEVWQSFREMGVPMPRLRIRSMRSRWGSCMPGKGVITLNRQLLRAPEECIEYVVFHEFCHFIHPDHSGRFYGLLESLLPDWKERKKKLNETVVL